MNFALGTVSRARNTEWIIHGSENDDDVQGSMQERSSIPKCSKGEGVSPRDTHPYER
jgi:hypothetical protein